MCGGGECTANFTRVHEVRSAVKSGSDHGGFDPYRLFAYNLVGKHEQKLRVGVDHGPACIVEGLFETVACFVSDCAFSGILSIGASVIQSHQ